MYYYGLQSFSNSLFVQISEVRNYFSTHKKQYEEHEQKLQASKNPPDVPGSALLFGVSKPASKAEIMASFPSKYITDILVARYFSTYDPATRKCFLGGKEPIGFELIEKTRHPPRPYFSGFSKKTPLEQKRNGILTSL